MVVKIKIMQINLFKKLHQLTLVALIAIALSLVSLNTFAATVSATLERHSIIENEIVQLTIRTDYPDTGNGPDFSVLEKDFNILSRSQNSQFRFNLGTSQSLKFWVVSLSPKSVGNFEIPPIQVGQYASKPLKLEVKTSPSLLDQNGNPPVIIELEVSDVQPYLQQEVIIKLKLYHSFALQNANISTPKHPDLVMERLTDDQVHNEIIKDTTYQVLTREYLAFPQKSGEIEIEAQTIAAMINTNRGRRLIKAQSNAITLNVQPVPDKFPSENWLPAKKVTTSSKLSNPNSRQAGSAQVGDTLIWTITSIADGAFPEQISIPEFISTRNYKLYPQPPEFTSSKSGEGIKGIQTVTIEVVPTVPGTLALPTIEIPYWDIKNRRLKHSHAASPTMEITGLPIIDETPVETKPRVKALLKPQPRSVAPIALEKATNEEESTALASSPISTNSDKSSNLNIELAVKDGTTEWSLRHMLVAFLLTATGLTLLFAIAIKLRNSKTTKPLAEMDLVPTLQEFAPLKTANEKEAFGQLLSVCQTNQLELLRSSLLEWARHRWGETSIRGLDDIKEQSQSNSLRELLMEAELIMYSDTAKEEWDGSNLAEALEEFYSGEVKPSKENQLKNLYPDL